MESLSSEDYMRLIEETKATVLEYGSQEWPVIKKSHGVEVSAYPVPHQKCKVYKAVGIFNLPPSELFQYVSIISEQSDKAKRKAHKIIKSWEVLREVNENVLILRTISKSAAGGVISAREYFDLVGTYPESEQGLHMSCATGIDYPYPKDDKYVRGWNIATGVMCYPLPGERCKTKLIYLLHTDLKGKVPTKLVEAALPDMQLSYFSNLRKIIEESSKT